jgi:ligand-binding sensor domain-containing protein
MTVFHRAQAGLDNSTPRINCFYEDRQNRLWIGTMGFGLLEYDRATGKIVNQYQHDLSANSLSSNAISSVLEDSFGEFRIATANMGLNRLDRET